MEAEPAIVEAIRQIQLESGTRQATTTSSTSSPVMAKRTPPTPPTTPRTKPDSMERKHDESVYAPVDEGHDSDQPKESPTRGDQRLMRVKALPLTNRRLAKTMARVKARNPEWNESRVESLARASMALCNGSQMGDWVSVFVVGVKPEPFTLVRERLHELGVPKEPVKLLWFHHNSVLEVITTPQNAYLMVKLAEAGLIKVCDKFLNYGDLLPKLWLSKSTLQGADDAVRRSWTAMERAARAPVRAYVRLRIRQMREDWENRLMKTCTSDEYSWLRRRREALAKQRQPQSKQPASIRSWGEGTSDDGPSDENTTEWRSEVDEMPVDMMDRMDMYGDGDEFDQLRRWGDRGLDDMLERAGKYEGNFERLAARIASRSTWYE